MGYAAHTGRGGSNDGPLYHDVPVSLPKASRTGKNYRAKCGASVKKLTNLMFGEINGRRCRKCSG